MSVEAMSWVFKHSQTKGAARLVMLALANEASRDGAVSAYARSYSHLARQANVSRTTVWRAIEEAEELGELVITKSGGGRERNNYQIVLSGCEVQPVAVRDQSRDETSAVADRDHSSRETQPEQLHDATAITPLLPVDDPVLPVNENGHSSFDEFWSVYPKKVAKGQAKAAWKSAVKAAGSAAVIMEGVEAAVAWWEFQAIDRQFIPHPATWLRAESWNDELASPHQTLVEPGFLPEPRFIDGEWCEYDNGRWTPVDDRWFEKEVSA